MESSIFSLYSFTCSLGGGGGFPAIENKKLINVCRSFMT